ESFEGFVEFGPAEAFLALRDGASDYVGVLQRLPGFGEQVGHLRLVGKLAIGRIQAIDGIAEELERIVAHWIGRGGPNFGIGWGGALVSPGANLTNCAHGS